MTQEELDALMSEDENLDSASSKDEAETPKDEPQEHFEGGDDFRAEASKMWPPPPPSSEHKVVHQLDDVTRDTEVKANEVFDQLDVVDQNANEIIKSAKKLKEYIKNQEDMFNKLSAAFPHIQSFKDSLNQITEAQNAIKTITDCANNCTDATMTAMDIMQFQDINRQRIERVINVMRALSQYMNSLFESKIDDSKRVASAVYISGDENSSVADSKEIEDLIASFVK